MNIEKKVQMSGVTYKIKLNSLDIEPKCEDCYFYGKTTRTPICKECFKQSNFCKFEEFPSLDSLSERLTEIIESLEKDKAELLLANKLLEAEVDVAKGNVIDGEEALREIEKRYFSKEEEPLKLEFPFPITFRGRYEMDFCKDDISEKLNKMVENKKVNDVVAISSSEPLTKLKDYDVFLFIYDGSNWKNLYDLYPDLYSVNDILYNKTSNAKWEIDDDGYYPYCSFCGYEPYKEFGENRKLPKVCPKCHSIIKEK